MRGDEQEPDMRCDVFETSGHVTTKSSICKRDTFYKFGVHAMTVLCLTPGDLLAVQGRTEYLEMGIDLQVEVSRGHSSHRYRQSYLGTQDRKVEQTDKRSCNVL